MTNRERKIIRKCVVALCSIPGQGNRMSADGAARSAQDMSEAIGLNRKTMDYLLDGEIESAERCANDLVSVAFRILLSAGIAVTPAMEALRKSEN